MGGGKGGGGGCRGKREGKTMSILASENNYGQISKKQMRNMIAYKK